MLDFEKLYHIMFNAATDAVNELDGGNTGKARETLVDAQRLAEETYIMQADSGERRGG